MVNFIYKDNYDFSDLVNIVKILRAPGGCPWDMEQTHESIRRNFLEEAYEAVEAIDEKDTEHMREELGDVLLQVVMHAEMESEQGTFDIDGVADGICKKLIHRHPHIFGNVEASTPEEVLKNWEDIKKQEKKQKSATESILSVAKSLPSLMMAEKIQSRAARVGFDFENVGDAVAKAEEELCELKAAIADGGNYSEELGDLLFSCVNVARFLKTDPEQALRDACTKFTNRFAFVEAEAKRMGKDLKDMSLAEMDALWDKAKLEKPDTGLDK